MILLQILSRNVGRVPGLTQQQWPSFNAERRATYRQYFDETNLRSAFSSGLKCVSLCLFRTGGPADELESESDDVWLVAEGKTTEMGRLKPDCEPPEEPACFPDIRRTLWAPPLPAVTTTMLVYPSHVVWNQK